MSMSFEEGLGLASKPSATSPTPKPVTMGFEAGLGLGSTSTSVPTPAKPSMLSGLHQAFNDHLDSALASQYKNSGEALALIRQGKHDMLADRDESKVLPVQNWKGVGEGLLGLFQYIWSPAQTLVDEVASKPTAVVIDKIAQRIPTSSSLKSGEPRPKFDPSIRPEDVKQTSAALNEFFSTAYSTAAGFVGGSGVAKSAEGAFDLLTPEAKAEFRSRQPRAEAAMDNAYAELAATDPAAAQELAVKIAPVDEKLSKKMMEAQKRILPYDSENLKAIGAQRAKIEIADAETKARAKQAGMERQGKLPEKEQPPPQPIVQTKSVPRVTPDVEAMNARVRADAERHARMLARQQDLAVAETVAQSTSKAVEVAAAVEDPKITYFHSGLDVPRALGQLRETRAGQILEGKLFQYYDQLIRNLNPEALSEDAKRGAAIVAKGIAGLAREDSRFVHQGEENIRYWLGQKNSMDFIHGFEHGKVFKDPKWNRLTADYKAWGHRIVEQDRRVGIQDYEELDHYLSHMYEDPQAARNALRIMYGPSWTQPGFTKARGVDTYLEAIEEGERYVARGEKNPFIPKYKNPEMLMQLRQHASDVAEMKVTMLRDLEKHGLAKKKVEGVPAPGTEWSSRPSPAGGSYWVKNDVAQIMNNAFDSKTLWNLEGLGGDLFRGAMFLKNAKVQVQLGLSAYHGLHLGLAMDSSTEIVRATKELLAGHSNPVEWFARVVKSPLGAFYENPKAGSRPLRAYRGQIAENELTQQDRVALKMMAEGGFIPEMSSQYRTKALDNFRRAIAEHSAKAVWHAPFAMMELMSKPMFEYWIPQLKIASYLKDVRTHLKLNPEHLTNDLARMQAFRKLAKSVDNNFGEMAYNTMFMNRWVKDIAVANTLSLGWQVGFIRQYGGAVLDVGQAVTKGGTLKSVAKSGLLDRPIFITAYTTQALGIGGLMTWAMTGAPPKEFKDYYLPRTGGTNPDGTPSRINTMFYTKEFASIAKHVQTEGVGAGLEHLVSNKASGLIGLAGEGIKGVDDWGNNIRDGDPGFLRHVGQTLSAMAPELEPISISAIQKQVGSNLVDRMSRDPGASIRAVAGFTPAPKYMTETETDARIDSAYAKTRPKETSYDKAQHSKDVRELRAYHVADDQTAFDAQLNSIQDKYQLTPKETRKLRMQMQKDSDPQLVKFKALEWQEQKRILDKATPEERRKLLPVSNKSHLRGRYEASE
jgi:hypothetical protein